MTTRTYPVGILYSTSGPYAALGADALDGALMALAEINEDESFPFTLRAEVGDAEGAIERYAPIADTLLRSRDVRHLVGCITSWSRKEVIPVIEKRGSLLWYSCPYEGFEANDHVIYTGACPNQHIVPLFAHVLPRYGVNAYLVGSNYIWGWETNRIARELLADCNGNAYGDRYLPIGSVDVGRIIDEIRQKKPDFVLNNLIGPSSYAFLAAYHRLGLEDADFLPARRPVVSCNVTEAELDMIGEAGIGHLSTATYFESLDTAANRAFLARTRQRLGAARRVSSFFASSWLSVRLLAEAIREAGSDEPEAIQAIVTSRSFSAPLGEVQVDRRTNHTALTPHLGRIAAGGRFEIVESAPGAVSPDPYLVDFNPAELSARVTRPNLRVIS